MVLTINSRGYLSLNHLPVIISADLCIFPFLPAEVSWRNTVTRWRRRNGQQIFQYSLALDMDIYIWIFLGGHIQRDLRICLFLF